MRGSRLYVAVSVAVLLAPVLGGCGDSKRGGGKGAAARKPAAREVVVLTPHGQEMLDEYAAAFERANPGAKVIGRFVPTGQILSQLRIDKGSPKVDVWWGGTSAFFNQAKKEGLLRPYKPSWAQHSKPGRHDPDGAWFAQFLQVPVVMFNRNIHRREQMPRTWDDLLLAQWRDKIVIREPMDSGTMKTIFGGLIWQRGGPRDPLPGYAFLKALDAQTHAYLPNPQAVYDRVAKSTEGYITLWNLTDVIYQARANGYPFDYRIPKGPLPISLDPIGIVAGAPHLEEAKRFYEFVTSKANCLRMARDHYRILARTDISRAEQPEWMKGLRFEAMPVDQDTFDRLQGEWMERWRKEIRNPEK
jgi:iron(III) transport system substrate-binding protein